MASNRRLLSALMVFGACSPEPTGGMEELSGEAALQIAAAPTDVACLRITVTGPTTSRLALFALQPGQPVNIHLNHLPLGMDVFQGDAFATSCGSVDSSSAPLWVSDPVSAAIDAVSIPEVTLVMHRPGRADISVTFEDDGGDSGGCPDGNTPCQCGFTIPNPPSTGLPHPQSYTDNGDGTVTDNVTGLVWEQKSSPSEAQCPGATCTQAQAESYCAAKGSDWRLPTRMELITLVDYTIYAPGPAINQTFFPGTTADTDYFWTSTPLAAPAAASAWFVYFTNINIVGASTTETGNFFRPRCVRKTRDLRGGATPNCYTTRYQIQDGLIVLDTATGLTWQRDVNDGGTGQDWATALNTCASLGVGWRLPSVLELESIVDDTRIDPSIDESIFPNTPSQPIFWTSSTYVGPPLEYPPSIVGRARLVEFNLGSVVTYIKSERYRVRCVR